MHCTQMLTSHVYSLNLPDKSPLRAYVIIDGTKITLVTVLGDFIYNPYYKSCLNAAPGSFPQQLPADGWIEGSNTSDVVSEVIRSRWSRQESLFADGLS